VIAIGGITTANVGEVVASGAAGAAVVGAVMAADDPGRAVEHLLRAWPPLA
jgi:thiamine-phosphate pyrophosphorylase